MGTLQDQMLKSGMVDANKARKLRKEKQRKQKPGKNAAAKSVSESAQRVDALREEQIARDRALNRQQQALQEQKAVMAQVKQLISMNALALDDAEIRYGFSDGSKVKALDVTAEVQRKLSSGLLAIARLEQGYVVIPRVVAEKVSLRDDAAVVVLNPRDSDVAEADDPYSEYEVPDDLMW